MYIWEPYRENWRVKGHKQLTKQDILRACYLADSLDKQGCAANIVIYCGTETELLRTQEAWDAFKPASYDGRKAMKYKSVTVVMA